MNPQQGSENSNTSPSQPAMKSSDDAERRAKDASDSNSFVLDEQSSATVRTVLTGPEDSPHYQIEGEFPTGPRYRRTTLHASGGMGRVWLARDLHIGREVALKEIRAERAVQGRAPTRFIREARITGQLEHPGIVPVYDLGIDAETGRTFYTMRFVKGRTLSQMVAAFHRHRNAGNYDPLEFVGLLTAFVSICRTLAYAHSHGIVHRDLKGENVVLGDYGEVIVLDWGLAKRLDGSDEDIAETPTAADEIPSTGAGQTMMGQVLGTPAYMAPEQAEGRMDLLGPATDIFGLGAILYEILTGRPPFAGGNTVDVLRRARNTEIASPRSIWKEVPSDLEAACLKAMAHVPTDRYPSATALADEVHGWQDKQRRLAEAELRQAFERLRIQQTALVALTRDEVFAGADLDATFRQLTEVAARTLNIQRVSIWRYGSDRRTLRCRALFELNTGRHSAGAELNADSYPRYFEAMATSEVIAAEDAQQDPRTSEFTQGYLIPLGIGAMLDVPVRSDVVLCHEHVGPPRKWLPDEELFAIAVGHVAAQAISHWERQQTLQQIQQT